MSGDEAKAPVGADIWHVPEPLSVYPRLRGWKRPDAIERFILAGWLPERPPLKRTDQVLAIGSCFARQIAHFLGDRGQSSGDVSLFIFDGRLMSTHAMRRHVEWALGLRDVAADETMYVEDKLTMGSAGRHRRGRPRGRRCQPIDLDEATRARTRSVIEASAGFVFTLGLSEMWFDGASGEAFLKAVPKFRFDPARHEFRSTTVAENRENIERIIAVVRSIKPTAPIVLTLSPQPLVATFRPVSCVTANCVSKSVLRVAIDEVMRANTDAALYYWPAYEIVTVRYGLSAFRHDGRHIHGDVAKRVVDLFDRYFIQPG